MRFSSKNAEQSTFPFSKRLSFNMSFIALNHINGMTCRSNISLQFLPVNNIIFVFMKCLLCFIDFGCVRLFVFTRVIRIAFIFYVRIYSNYYFFVSVYLCILRRKYFLLLSGCTLTFSHNNALMGKNHLRGDQKNQLKMQLDVLDCQPHAAPFFL